CSLFPPHHPSPPAAVSTLSLHDALPICGGGPHPPVRSAPNPCRWRLPLPRGGLPPRRPAGRPWRPRDCRSRSAPAPGDPPPRARSEEHTSELQSRENLVCRLLLEKKNK